MKDKTLVIMAAGMGSRFGGLKQIEAIGPNGEFLIDYSIYDAIKVGFNKIVFIIKEENYDIFKDTIGSRVPKNITVEYVFQNLKNIPENFKIPTTRIKPLGTSHAILCTKEVVNEPFIIINADDFYGYDAFLVASQFLENKKENEYCVIGYEVEKTLSENGSVKRAVCLHQNDELINLIESKIIKEQKIIASPLDGSTEIIMERNDLVSMNLLCFDPSIFSFLESRFVEFLTNWNLETDEFLIPTTLQEANTLNYAKVKVLKTDAKWYGITYKEDKEKVVKAIDEMIKNNIYPNILWNK